MRNFFLGLVLSISTFGCKAQDVQVVCLKNYYLAGVSVPTSLNGTKFTGIKLTTVGASSSTYLTYPVNTSVSGSYVALRGNNGYTANIKYTAALPAFANTGALVAFVQGCVPDALPTGGADNWGSQVVQHDATLTGIGIIGNTLRVDTSKVVTPYTLSLNRPVIQSTTRPTYYPDDNTDARIWHNITDGIMYEYKDGKWYSFGTINSPSSPFQSETIEGVTVSNIFAFWFNPTLQQTYVNIGGEAGGWQLLNTGASGAAGGDLVGTYPNPFIGAGKVTSSKIAPEAVTTSKIAEGAITNSKIADNAVTTATILDAHVTAPKIADGAVTISKIATGAITNAKIADGVVSESKIATGAVTNTQLGANSVTNVKIADGAITAGKLSTTGATDGQAFIYSAFLGGFELKTPAGGGGGGSPTGIAGGVLSGTYPNPDLAINSISTAAIQSGAVTQAKLSEGAVNRGKIEDGAINGDKLDHTGAIEGSYYKYIAASNTFILSDPITGSAPIGAAGGDLTGNYPNPELAVGSVGTSELAIGAVTNSKIAVGGVSLNKLSSVGATEGKVLTFNGTLTYPEWRDPLIQTATGTAGGSLSGTYPNPSITAGAIGATQLASQAVTFSKLAPNAVTTSAIGNLQVTPAKLNVTGATDGQVLAYNSGSGLTQWTTLPSVNLPIPLVLNQQNVSTLGGGITFKKAVNNSTSDWTIEQYSGTNGTTNPPILRLYPTANGYQFGLSISEQGKLVIGAVNGNINVASSPSFVNVSVSSGLVGIRNFGSSSTAGAVGMDIDGNVVKTSETQILNFGSNIAGAFGTIRFSVPSTGNKSLQATTVSGGNVIVIGSASGIAAGIRTNTNCSQTLNSTASYFDSLFNATNNGDIQELTLYDSTNQIAYRVFCIYNFTANKAIITVHKLN